MGTGEFTARGNPAMDYHPIQGGVELLLVTSCYRNRDKLRPDGPLGSYADYLNVMLDRIVISKLYSVFEEVSWLPAICIILFTCVFSSIPIEDEVERERRERRERREKNLTEEEV